VVENTEHLRQNIDSGRTGHKVAGLDPAVAPLGADDEAAGTRRPAHEIANTRHRETMRPHETSDLPGLGHAWILIAFTLLLAIAIVAWTIAIHALESKQDHAQVWAPVITSVPVS
jgi:hypothetical protein